jgi:5-methylcytosine-specific restriction protein A
MPRKEFPRKVKAAIIDRAQGRCEACRASLKVGEGEVDHRLPDALGGKPELANAWLLCRACHKSKSGHDIRSVRKADRARDKSTGAIRPKGRIPSPPKAEKPERRPSLPPRILFWACSGHSESGD